MIMYVENSKFVYEVTKMLNENMPEIASGDFYIHVELRENGSHEKRGQWTDEIGPDCWGFESGE